MNKVCYILVDFDNFIPRDFSFEDIDNVLQDVLKDVINSHFDIDYIRIRLYGG